VVEQPPCHRVGPRFGLDRPGQLRRVGLDQVVHGEPVRLVFLDQRRLGQLEQRGAGLLHRDGGQARRGRQADVRTGTGAEHPEHARGAVAEVRAGLGEYGARDDDRVGRVAEAARTQLGRQRRQPQTGGSRRASGGDAQRQRQSPAQRAQFAGRLRLGPQPRRTEALLQQFPGFKIAERAESQQPRSRVGQTRRHRPGREQHQAAGGVRKKAPYLGGVMHVVDDDEDAPSGQQAPVQGGPLVRFFGQFPGRDAEGLEEAAQRVRFRHRLGRVTETSKADIQVSVGEAALDPVRDVNRQRGLADTAWPLDHRDDGASRDATARDATARVGGLSREADEDFGLLRSAHEVRHVHRKLPRLSGRLAGLSRISAGQVRLCPQADEPPRVDAMLGEFRREFPDNPQRGDRIAVQPAFPGRLFVSGLPGQRFLELARR